MSLIHWIPSQYQFSPIESAYVPRDAMEEQVTLYARGPISRVIGKCAQFYGAQGQCVGTFKSTDVDAYDIPVTIKTDPTYCYSTAKSSNLAYSGDPQKNPYNPGYAILNQQPDYCMNGPEIKPGAAPVDKLVYGKSTTMLNNYFWDRAFNHDESMNSFGSYFPCGNCK